MKKYLFYKNETIYKANLHCHTTISDGEWTPEETKKKYQEHGYQVVAYTDHDVLKNHKELSNQNFLALNAVEFELVDNRSNEPYEKRKVYHFNLYANDSEQMKTPQALTMDYEDIDSINTYIKERNEEGYLVCYNHPYWSLQTYEDYSRLKGCFAMEIYNHGGEVTDGYYGYNPQVYDEMLRNNQKIYCLATDDNHTMENAFGGYVMIQSSRLDYSNIINALRQGNFYSSLGPELYEISIEGRELYVKCSNVCLIVAYTDGRICYIKKGECLTEAKFHMIGNEKYIRIMCQDQQHRCAWSNAYWL